MKNYYQLLLPIVLSLSFSLLFSNNDPQTAPSFIEKIYDIHMQNFPWGENSDRPNKSYEDFLANYLEKKLNPSPRLKRHSAFLLHETIQKKQKQHDQRFVINPVIWRDLDLFYGKEKPQTFLANSIDRTQTEIGKISLYTLLAQPTTDTVLLKNRQQTIKSFIENDQLYETVKKSITSIKNAENVLLSFWGEDHFKSNSEKNYFLSSDPLLNMLEPILIRLNKNNTALLLKNSHDHFNRIMWTTMKGCAAGVLLSYGIFHGMKQDPPEQLNRWADDFRGYAGPVLSYFWNNQNRFIHATVALAGGMACAFSLKNNLDHIREQFLLENCIQTLMIHIAEFTKGMKEMYEAIKPYEHLAQFEEFKKLGEFFEKQLEQSEELKELVESLEEETFQGEASMFSHKGLVLRAYALMHELKGNFEDAIQSCGKIDAYCAVALLIKESSEQKVRFSFPEYIQAEKPSIMLHNFWHPLVSPNHVVPNSIVLGIDNHRRNLIITGPNAGGKSTVLKAITVCLILAQTIGVVPADAMTFTPFCLIDTYLNIADDVGAGNSLFKAEVLRAQHLVHQIQQTKPGDFNFAVFDEMFTGTSPTEGIAAAYSVAKHLGTFENSIFLIATHFIKLSELESMTDQFSNYKVSVACQEDGKITYPYKLLPGVSHQHVALDILRNEGFSGVVIDEARKIVQEISTRSPEAF